MFKALADPTRRSLLDELFERDGQTLSALERRLPMTRFGVMKHLRVLEAARLPHDIHVMAGDPVSRILEASNRFRNAHVVMGARRRRLFGARGFGSVADRIVLEIRRPLTLVK